MRVNSPVTISRKEGRAIVRLLGELQGHLESMIESSTLEDGSISPADAEQSPGLVAELRKMRRQWKQAEGIVATLDLKCRRNRN